MTGEARAVTAIRAMLRIDEEEEFATVRDLAERIGQSPEMVVALMEIAVRQRWEIEGLKDRKGPTYPSYRLEDELHRFERNEIVSALEACGWVANRAAKELGIPLSTLKYKMRGYGLKRTYADTRADDEEESDGLHAELP